MPTTYREKVKNLSLRGRSLGLRSRVGQPETGCVHHRPKTYEGRGPSQQDTEKRKEKKGRLACCDAVACLPCVRVSVRGSV